MSFWVDQKNKYKSQVDNVSRCGVSDWVPKPVPGVKYGIFGGVQEQRIKHLGYAIARSYGNQGVIIISNNTEIFRETKKSSISQKYPRVISECERRNINVEVAVINSRNRIYNPLYGMSIPGVINTFYDKKDNVSSQIVALGKYIEIIDKNGMYLDLKSLLEVSKLDIDELEKRYLRCYSEEERLGIRSTFTKDNCYRNINEDIEKLKYDLMGVIWDEESEETANTMIGAADNKGIIIINPSTRKKIIEYLASELKDMIDLGKKFTLIIDSVNIADTGLYELISTSKIDMPIYISGESPQVIMGETEVQSASVISQLNRITLLNTKNAQVSKQYSGLIGEYLRIFEDKNSGNTSSDGVGQSGPTFGKAKGKAEHEQLFQRVRPEEFMRLGEGAVLIDQDRGEVYRANYYL